MNTISKSSETAIMLIGNVRISVARKQGGYSIPSQKRFGELTNKKGKELKNAFFDFRVEVGKIWNGEIAGMQSRDEILAQRIVPTKHGLRVDYIRTETLSAPTQKAVGKVEKETLLKAAQKLVEAGKFSSIDEAIAFLA